MLVSWRDDDGFRCRRWAGDVLPTLFGVAGSSPAGAFAGLDGGGDGGEGGVGGGGGFGVLWEGFGLADVFAHGDW